MKKLFLFLMLGIFLISFTSAFDWNSGLVSYYKLDETSGTVINQIGTNGTNIGGTPNQIGKINTAYNFDGGNNNTYINLNSNLGLNGINTASFCSWLNPKVQQGEGGLLSKDADDSNDFAIEFTAGTNDLTFFSGAGVISQNNFFVADQWIYTCVTINSTAVNFYRNGSLIKSTTGLTMPLFSINNLYLGWSRGLNTYFWHYTGKMDEVGIWNRTLSSSEISELYNGGNGLPYSVSNLLQVSLTSPVNNIVLSTIGTNFTANFNITGATDYTWKNATYYIWYSNGTIFNKTEGYILTGNNTNINNYIDSFSIGDYYWNIEAWYGNATYNNYTWATNNLTFVVGATINSETHNNNTYETDLETFTIGVNLLENSELSLAKLVYNGTEYIVSNITIYGNGSNVTALLSKSINIPLNVNPYANQTNSFYWKFTYNGGQVQTLTTYTQNVSFINLQLCNATYSNKTLNFTFYDELNQTNLNASTYPLNLLLNFKYWKGGGTVKKNYSFQTLGNNTNNSFQFCFLSGGSLQLDMDMQYYSAINYAERSYYYRNETLTNVTKNVLLYSILSSEATKFSVNIKEGTEVFANAIVGVWKYFVGLNSYKLVMVGLTDDKGQFNANLDLDQTYNFTVVKNGVSYGSFIKQGSCSATPCTIDLNIISEIINPNDAMTAYFAQYVIYNLTKNDTTQILTLNFEDTLGTAQYWRLLVTKNFLNNDTELIICDTKSYASIGSMACNYTGYDGDLNANVYISRSPEKLVVIFNWVNSLDYKTFGDSAILASVILILVIFFVGIRNPVNALVLIPFALIVLKFIQFLPFSWGWIVGITIIDLWLISKLKT